MSDDRGTLREIAWRELFPWLILFRTARPALDPRKLAIAALALVVTAAGWWSLGQLFSGSDDEDLREAIIERDVWPWQSPLVNPPARVEIASDLEVDGSLIVHDAYWEPTTLSWAIGSGINPISHVWHALSEPFWRLFDVEQSLSGFTYFLLCALWATAVWSLAAAAITRIAAVELALEERLPLRRAVLFARDHWVSCFWTPLFPLLGVLLAVALMALGGWLLQFDATIFVLAILWPLYLLAGFVMALLLLGLMFGWPLMWPAIGSEGTDLFDGISRSYSYVYQRPFHYLFYVVVAAFFGALAWLLVAGIAAAVIQLSFWGASFTGGAERTAAIMEAAMNGGEVPGLGGLGGAGVMVLSFWVACVQLLAVAFAFSYFWTSSTAIYLLLRRAADAKEMDEVYVEDEPEPRGLPALARDKAGVPVVATEETNGEEGNGDDVNDNAPPAAPEDS